MAEAKLAGTMLPGPMWPLIGRMVPGQARVLDTRIRRNEDSSFTVSFTSPAHRHYPSSCSTIVRACFKTVPNPPATREEPPAPPLEDQAAQPSAPVPVRAPLSLLAGPNIPPAQGLVAYAATVRPPTPPKKSSDSRLLDSPRPEAPYRPYSPSDPPLSPSDPGSMDGYELATLSTSESSEDSDEGGESEDLSGGDERCEHPGCRRTNIVFTCIGCELHLCSKHIGAKRFQDLVPGGRWLCPTPRPSADPREPYRRMEMHCMSCQEELRQQRLSHGHQVHI